MAEVLNGNTEQPKLEINNPESNSKYSILKKVASEKDKKELNNTKKETSGSLDNLKIINEIRTKISKDFSDVEGFEKGMSFLLSQNQDTLKSIQYIFNGILGTEVQKNLNDFFNEESFFLDDKTLSKFIDKYKDYKETGNDNKATERTNENNSEQKDKSEKLNAILEKNSNNPIFERVLKEHDLTKENFVQKIIDSPEEGNKFAIDFLTQIQKESIKETNPEKKKELESMFGAVSRDFVSAGIISHEEIALIRQNIDNQNLPERDRQAIINGGFSGVKLGDDVMIKGSKIFYEDSSGLRQTWDTGEHPPVKYLEQNGIKIESKVRYEPNYEYQVKKEGLLGEIGTLENSISGKQKEIKSIFNKFKISGSNYEGNLTFSEQYNLFTASIDAQIQKAKEESPSDLPFLESMKAKVNSLKDEIKNEFEKYEKAKKDLQELEKKEKSRIPDYKEMTAKNDEIIKNNLTYLKSLHLDIFGDKIDKFIALINRFKETFSPPGLRNIDLSQELSQNDKSLISKALIRILGENGKELFDETGTRMLNDQNSTSEKIKDKLVKTGALAQNRTDINILNIEALLEKGDK